MRRTELRLCSVCLCRTPRPWTFASWAGPWWWEKSKSNSDSSVQCHTNKPGLTVEIPADDRKSVVIDSVLDPVLVALDHSRFVYNLCCFLGICHAHPPSPRLHQHHTTLQMTNNTISLLDLLIFSAPKGQSPYAFAADFIAHILPDKVSTSTSGSGLMLRLFISARLVLQASDCVGSPQRVVSRAFFCASRTLTSSAI